MKYILQFRQLHMCSNIVATCLIPQCKYISQHSHCVLSADIRIQDVALGRVSCNSGSCFEQPESLECVRRVRALKSKRNWLQYAGQDVSEMKGHLLKYPVEVDRTGKVESLLAVQTSLHRREDHWDIRSYPRKSHNLMNYIVCCPHIFLSFWCSHFFFHHHFVCKHWKS